MVRDSEVRMEKNVYVEVIIFFNCHLPVHRDCLAACSARAVLVEQRWALSLVQVRHHPQIVHNAYYNLWIVGVNWNFTTWPVWQFSNILKYVLSYVRTQFSNDSTWTPSASSHMPFEMKPKENFPVVFHVFEVTVVSKPGVSLKRRPHLTLNIRGLALLLPRPSAFHANDIARLTRTLYMCVNLKELSVLFSIMSSASTWIAWVSLFVVDSHVVVCWSSVQVDEIYQWLFLSRLVLFSKISRLSVEFGITGIAFGWYTGNTKVYQLFITCNR